MHFKYRGVGEQNIKLVFCQSLSSVPKLASVLIVQYNSATRKPAHAGLHKDLVHESLALPRLRQRTEVVSFSLQSILRLR